MSSVLTVDGVTKYYGRIRALNNVSFEVPQASVFGVLGPNGSGKTTLLSIILDVLKATKGDFLWFGHPGSPEQRKKIGSLLETPNFYHYMSAVDNLEISASIKGITNPDIDGVLKKVNLYQHKDSKFQTYSLGMKQRLAIASCLLGDPEVMVFDEPTNGLDPVGIAEIRDLIKRLAKEGKTIIMASHLLDEVEKVCTHVAILKKGVLIAQGHVDEILVNDDIVEVSSGNNEQLRAALQTMTAYTKIDAFENDKMTIHFPPGTADLAQVNAHCFKQGIVLNHLVAKKKSLESKFIELTNE